VIPRGNAVKFFGTKRHHEKWLKNTEDYVVKGCFAMTELGHGSNVGIFSWLPFFFSICHGHLPHLYWVLFISFDIGTGNWNSDNLWPKNWRVCDKYSLWICSEVLDWWGS